MAMVNKSELGKLVRSYMSLAIKKGYKKGVRHDGS